MKKISMAFLFLFTTSSSFAYDVQKAGASIISNYANQNRNELKGEVAQSNLLEYQSRIQALHKILSSLRKSKQDQRDAICILNAFQKSVQNVLPSELLYLESGLSYLLEHFKGLAANQDWETLRAEAGPLMDVFQSEALRKLLIY
ncbi:MAG: hypothetical protein H7333_08225 [Bdellovibrionales bacterium]|nr:hypothetical protein [Oligoflexia bacterium]